MSDMMTDITGYNQAFTNILCYTDWPIWNLIVFY